MRGATGRRRLHSGPVLLGAALFVVASCSCAKNNDPSASTPTTSPTQGTTASGGASFSLPTDPGAAIRLASLPEISTESPPPLAPLKSAHLDLVISGQPVDVPAGIGVTKSGRAPVYTHDAGGVIRVEPEASNNPPDKPEDVITIGQFFTTWGVKLEKNCLATYCTDDKNQLLGYHNGQLVPDPASIPVTDGAEIYIWYGPRGTNPKAPATYDIPKSK